MNLTGFLFKGIRARNKLWFPCYPWYLKTNTAGHTVVFFRKHQPWEFFFPLWKEFSFLAHIWCWWFRLFLGLTRVPQSSHFHGSFLNWFAGWCFTGGGQLLLKRKQCWLWFWLHSVHVFRRFAMLFFVFVIGFPLIYDGNKVIGLIPSSRAIVKTSCSWP